MHGQQTDRLFTDQRAESAALGALYDYGARRYDTLLGRFISADTIVPGAGNPQALNRYAYTFNNPLKLVDPSGHDPDGFDAGQGGCGEDLQCVQNFADNCRDQKCNERIVRILKEVLEVKRNQKGLSQSEELILTSAKQTVQGMESASSFVLPDGTVSVGIAGSASVGVEVASSIGFIHVDDDGNVILGSFTLGVGGSSGISAAGGGFIQVTNAASVGELEGWFINTGASCCQGVVVNPDAVFGTGSKGRIEGLDVMVGRGAQLNLPVPSLGIHANANYTWLSPLRFKLW